MPACEGRPSGPCPDQRKDKSVHLSQGDLMLCDNCERFRFPEIFQRSAAKGTKNVSNNRIDTAQTEAKLKSRLTSKQHGLPETISSADGATSQHTTDCRPQVVFNELLMYRSNS